MCVVINIMIAAVMAILHVPHAPHANQLSRDSKHCAANSRSAHAHISMYRFTNFGLSANSFLYLFTSELAM